MKNFRLDWFIFQSRGLETKGSIIKKLSHTESIKTVKKTFQNRFFTFQFTILDLRLFHCKNTTSPYGEKAETSKRSKNPGIKK